MELTASRLRQSLDDLPAAPRYWVALSGGLDSTVLLHALVAALDEPARRLAAVHVHHGLHGQAGAWAERCAALCAARGVSCRVLRVDARPAPGQSPEAAARQARYGALAGLVGPEEGLLTAHHQDDQAETLLLQLLRGAGPQGLAAMPAWAPFAAGWLGRPLLDWPRTELRAYAERHALDWIEDPSNSDTGLARNALRHEILPRLRAHWPALARTLARAARHQGDAAAILDERGAADLAGALAADGGLSAAALGRLSEPRQRNLLRHWLQHQGLALPDAARLQRILEEVIPARADAEPRVAWRAPGGHGVEVRRYRDRLYALSGAAPSPGSEPRVWDLAHPLALAASGRRLVAHAVRGAGLSAAACAAGTITVRFRRGGEQCRPAGRGHRHALKKLFQEWGVAPWERERVPLIYIDDELAQVVGYCLCDPFAAAADERGWRIALQAHAADHGD